MKFCRKALGAAGPALGALFALAAPAQAAGAAAGQSLEFTLPAIFLAGLALNLTPCVYPLIPITVSFFAGRAASRAGTVAHALTYLLGLVVMYAGLGCAAALGGAMFGEALSHPLVLVALAAFILLMAASQFGLWEIRLPSRLTTAAAADRAGYLGSFLMGLTAGVLAVSCVAPVVAGLLARVAQVGDLWFGFKTFGVLALGLGLPLAVLAFFSEAASKLPAAGDWMVWVKKLFGWVLVGMALYVLMPLVGEEAFRWGLFLLGLMGAVHLGLLEKSGRGRFVGAKRLVAVALAAGSVAYLGLTWPAAAPAAQIPWQPLSQSAWEQAKKENKPVALDFTADWCAYCRQMDATTYRDPRVVEKMAEFMPLRLDVTRQSPEKRALMRRLGVRGLPTVVFLNSQGQALPELNLSGYRDASTMLMWLKLVLSHTVAKVKPAKPGS